MSSTVETSQVHENDKHVFLSGAGEGGEVLVAWVRRRLLKGSRWKCSLVLSS